MTSTTSPGDRPGRGHLAERCFVVAIAGLPVWWLLGLASLVPLALAVPLAWDLRKRRRVTLPPYAGWWVLFLLWVVLGVGTLWAAAPGAVDDGGAGRLLVFGYRLAWYAACTVLLVWIGNTPTDRLPDQLVRRVLAWVFVVTVAGGLLGILAPDLAVTTLAERVLPGGLRSNGFVSTLVSAETADVQKVLGAPEPRPKAPFAYTNTWGSVISLTLVFFVATLVAGRARLRWLAAPVLAAAAVPIVLSLNRGLWLALGVAAVGLLALLALRRNHTALGVLVAVVVLGGVLVPATSLGATVSERLDHPHSNERRSQLLVATVDSMSRGSPVVGFGSTRDVEGSFASIAGGATPTCPACGVPPLGTQGQLWLVLFSQGWIGTLFFLAFFVLALRRTWRCRTVNQTVATFVLGIFLLQLTVYDTLGLPMMIVMAAVGLAWREEQTGTALRRPPARALVAAATIGLIGAAIGAGATRSEDRHVASTVTVALTPSPTYLDVGDIAREADSSTLVKPPDPATIDTEAALLRSERALDRAGTRVGIAPAVLRSDIRVAAPPLSTVLDVTVTTTPAHDPAAAALAVAQEYLTERGRFLETRRTDLIARLDERLAAIDAADPAWAATRAYLRAASDHLTTHRPEVGSVIRVGPVRTVGADPGVPVTSGLALGGLVALASHRTPPRIRPRTRTRRQR
ncbi:hypothetical protein [Nocardioides daeguensis]|uniref:hypothetical protein n=1 Tax=Nocardioides daeguensis TaxID=908359 RepID=UPI001C450E76|nr:hypothetical protein [Nocardioides daeguensis]MBV6727043.1 hypothetical protein [Nocardioides daeguensis]MCR1771554.1 hypothetical protein [Nocardioides daeguensis]